MLAKISLNESPLSRELLDGEHSLRKQSKHGCVPPNNAPGHADGCGLAYINDGTIQCERRGKENVWDDSFINLVRTVKSKLAIAHSRKASTQLGENLGVERAHPFLRDFKAIKLGFCHNGFVGAVSDQAKKENRVDSELFFEQIINGIEEPAFEPVRSRVSYLAREYGRDFSCLNAFLMSPTHIFGWRLFRADGSKELPVRDWYDDYYTLWWKRTGDTVLIASEPTDRSPDWERFKNGQFIGVGIKAGQITVQQKELEF